MSDWNTRNQIFIDQANSYCFDYEVDHWAHYTHISLRYNYWYAETPKVACSTIKKTLIQAELGRRLDFASPEYIHYREFSPLLRPSQVGDLPSFFENKVIFKFCFVRNPYTRLLSAYLDKIYRNRREKRQLLAKLGREAEFDQPLSFQDFVRMIVDLPVSEMDAHWRIQYHQTFQSTIKYDFIGRFERFEEDYRKLLDQIGIDHTLFGSHEYSHATAAHTRLGEYYTPDLIKKVYQKFEPDFEAFGYGPSLPL